MGGNNLFVWLLVWLVMFVIWFAPVLVIALSRKGNGTERALWALVAVFVSWIGFFGFLLSTRAGAGEQGMRNG